MNDDQYLLANAYVDGELTAGERSIAEADPDVMSEVVRIRALRAQLRDVEAPSTSARESALAAAMAEFAPAAAAHPAAPAPRTVAFRPRPAYQRYLAFAAAVVAVGLLGVVIVNGIGGGDDDDTAVSDDTAETVLAADQADAGDTADADAAADSGPTELRDLAESEAAGDAAEAPAVADEATAGDAADADAAVDETFAASDDAAGDDAAAESDDAASVDAAIVPADPPADPATIPDPVELGLVGADLLAARDDGSLPPTPNTDCVFPDAEDPAVILGRAEFEVAMGTIELLVAVDEVADVAYGIDPGSCEILVVGPLP
jgi:hypothetical protein